MDIVLLLILVVEVCFLCFVDSRLWQTVFTPFIALSVPFTVVTVATALLSAIDDGVPAFYYPSLGVWMAGLLLFMVPSVVFSVIGINKVGSPYLFDATDDSYYILFRNVTFVILAVNMWRLSAALLSSVYTFGSDELSDEYEAVGLVAHLNQLLYALFPYMLLKADRHHKSAYAVIALTLVGMFAINVKSWIVAPLVAGFLLRVLAGKTVLSFRSVLLLVGGGVAVFYFSYLLLIVVTGQSELSVRWFDFVSTHLETYIIGGVLSFSLDFQQGILEPEMTESLFGPVINLFKALFGGEFTEVINPVRMSLGSLDDSNVRTFMGTIYCYSQSVGVSAAVVLYVSTLTYSTLWLFRHFPSLFTALALCFNLTFLSLGFFEFYWLNLSCYELPVLCLFIDVVLYRFKIVLPANESTE
jgi:hypothetical protein